MLNEQLQRIVLGALTSFLATFGGCLGTGCATKVTSIGEVSQRPLIELDLPGLSLKVHTVAMTFKQVEAETETP